MIDQHLIIQQGDRYLGIEIPGIVEIIRMVKVNSLPDSASQIAGVINYRGEIIPVVNLWNLLGQPTPKLNPDMGIVVLTREGRIFGLIVEKVLDVRELKVLPRPDELIVDAVWPLVNGVSYVDDLSGMLLALNIERIWREQKPFAEENEREAAGGFKPGEESASR